jgi:hypothetical protein
MVKAKQLLEVSPAPPLRLVAHVRVCPFDLAKVTVHLRQVTLDSLRLLVTGHRARVPQLPLAAERSSDFQF